MDYVEGKRYRIIIVLAVLFLGVLALIVKAGFLVGVDHSVSAQVLAIKTPFIDSIAQSVTFFGSSPWMIAMAIAMAIYWKRINRLDLLKLFLQGWFIGLGIQILLRYSIAQWRPDTVALEFPLSFIDRYEFAGFPSGHVFRSSFLFGWWYQSLRLRKMSWASMCTAFCIAMILGVGFTRIYLNRHWMSDVLGSWLLATIMLIWVGMRRAMRANSTAAV